MRRCASSFLSLALLLPFSCHLSAQTPAQSSAALLESLFKEIWEDTLKRSPEFASSLGDRRYNDQLTDLSPRAFNAELERGRAFLNRLIAIDASALSDQQKLSSELMQRQLIEDQESPRLRPWELPINQFHDAVSSLPAQLAFAPFSTVKDYDDYIARLHLVPAYLRQVSEDLLAGIDDHRVQPASMLRQTLAQTETISAQPPAESPFAAPLSEFPSNLDADQRKRISAAVLDAIQTDVLPAYMRFARFLRVTELPAADVKQTEPQPFHRSGDQLRRTEIVNLLIKAEAALDNKFDLEAFRNLIAANSALPLDALEQRVDAWIKKSS